MSNENKSLGFFIFLIVIVLGIAGYRFEKYYIAKDYLMDVFTACDPATQSCFEANPDIADPGFQTGPYEKVEITARYAPSCLDEHTCSNFSCSGVGGTCSITYCSEEMKENGENCSNRNP